MTKTVLVLGASGLIGTATIDAFMEEDGWEVVAVSQRGDDPWPANRRAQGAQHG